MFKLKIVINQYFAKTTTVDIEDIALNEARATPGQVSFSRAVPEVIAKEIGQTAIPVGYLADSRMILGHNAERGVHLVTHREAFVLALQTGAPRVSVLLLSKDQALRVAEIY